MAKKKEANKNMELWNQVCETNPTITKRVNKRGGFTAIDAQSQVKKATELFGPFGAKWGLRDLNYDFIPDGNGNIIGVYLVADFYYVTSIGAGNTKDTIIRHFPIAADMPYKPNDDCFKKLQTDCITKALSRLGFNSDVFEGKFDDQKYVDEMNKKYKVKDKPKPKAKPAKDEMDGKLLQKIAEEILSHTPDMPKDYMIDMKMLKAAIMNKFGKYPTKESSIPIVLNKINVEDVMVENDFVKGLE